MDTAQLMVQPTPYTNELAENKFLFLHCAYIGCGAGSARGFLYKWKYAELQDY